jgi:hypothetical protein
MPTVLVALQDHGRDIENIRTTMTQLDEKLVDGFQHLDNRLERIERNGTTQTP